MRILSDLELERATEFLAQAAEESKKSPCLKAHCGAIVINDGKVIGRGFNSPAKGDRLRCNDEYIIPENNKHNVTCCMHAEVRAIHDAFQNDPTSTAGSTLYFMRTKDGENTKAGVPFCTTCSNEALDSGVKEFVLWHESGITAYDTIEYNELSYQFFKDKNLWQLK